MKKAGIVTIYDNNNFGNRLQNYATQEILKEYDLDVVSFKNLRRTNYKTNNVLQMIKQKIEFYLKSSQNLLKKTQKQKELDKFNKKYMNIFPKYITGSNAKKLTKDFDYLFTGSDQVWNPKTKRMSYVDLLGFSDNAKKISFSASLAVDSINEEEKERAKKYLKDYTAISVRESKGKEILDEVIDKEVEVLLDPTMLITSDEWDKIIENDEKINNKKYILTYFLGTIPENTKKEVERIAQENECEIINIMDKDSEYYSVGPDVFVNLEKNAFLVCTDSFHSCVFAILYDRPFIVFKREGSKVNMNSRIENLLNMFQLENRVFEGKITGENLKHDYSNAYSILEKERQKAKNFLDKALS